MDLRTLSSQPLDHSALHLRESKKELNREVQPFGYDSSEGGSARLYASPPLHPSAFGPSLRLLFLSTLLLLLLLSLIATSHFGNDGRAALTYAPCISSESSNMLVFLTCSPP